MAQWWQKCSCNGMSSISSINGLSNSYLESIIAKANQNGNSTAIQGSSNGLSTDNSQVSEFAQLMSTLQQLQQSNPTQYEQVTQQIATNLTSAAQTAQSEGNTTAANQLTQLANDFTNASQTGQMPVGGHHHHHHHAAESSGSASSSTSDALNPLNIISNTLSSAGLTSSSSQSS
jgi:hypothetical protein